MRPRVDQFGKVTVSLGGVCPLACRHCYTMTSVFMHDPESTVAEVVADLRTISDPFSTICVSGDTDPFVDAAAGFLLIQELAQEFSFANIMFTTRLIPTDDVLNSLVELGRRMSQTRRLLVPGISFVSMKVPNFSERSRRIPSATERMRLLAAFRQGGMPALLALRPTFPLQLVGEDDVASLIGTARVSAVAVLGEIFLIDSKQELAKRLGLPAEAQDRHGPMTFMEQPDVWLKRTFNEALNFARRAAYREGLPYFLRSGSAMEMLKHYWDFQTATLRPGYLVRSDHDAEPDP